MIDFQNITPAHREALMPLLLANKKSCEFSFVNLCIWGRQQAANMGDFWVFFSQFDRKAVYPCPVGQGDIRPVIEAIVEDAHQRGIACCITGLTDQNTQDLDAIYPGRFRYACDRGSYDYVYQIDDLADLKGRKFQKKRNHVNRFRALYPNHRFEPMTAAHLEEVRQMAADWYRVRQESMPEGNYHLEQTALARALDHFTQLPLDGMVLRIDGQIVAFTMASPLTPDTMDVHFEKAREDIDGAYAAINQAFAGYLREKYPQLRYLDREEDMGLEGLRKAKLSYCPDHMQEKCWARFWEDQDEDR